MPIRPPANVLAPLLFERHQLINALAGAINQTFRAADVGCANPPGEVDRLVYFFAEGLPLIEEQFNLILEPHHIRVNLSGIFCHQTPRVVPQNQPGGATKACELGDILFVTTYGRRLFGHIAGNGMLVQAKQQIQSVRGSLQEFLYERADGFEYQSPGILAGQQRNLGECRNSLWYWGFDQWRTHFQMREWQTHGVCSRNSQTPHFWPFEVALMDLICGVTGRRWYALPENSPQTGWSKMVNDLIRVTANSALRRQNAFIVRNRETLRGEDAISAINQALGQPAPYLVRASLKRFFQIFDPEMEELGAKFEKESSLFIEEEFKERAGKRFAGRTDGPNKPPPNLGDERPIMRDDEGGCSFVVVDISQTNG